LTAGARNWSGHNSSGYDLTIDGLAFGEGNGLGIGVTSGIDAADGGLGDSGARCVAGWEVGRQGHSSLSFLGQMGDGWSLSITGNLLPQPDLKALGAGILFLLFRLLGGSLGLGLVLLGWRRSLVQASGARGPQKLLSVRREQVRVLGHAVWQFDGPNVVLLCRLDRRRGRDTHPLLTPLAYGQTFWARSIPGHLNRGQEKGANTHTLEIVMFDVSSSIAAARLRVRAYLEIRRQSSAMHRSQPDKSAANSQSEPWCRCINNQGRRLRWE
jgi:hypothetical protein